MIEYRKGNLFAEKHPIIAHGVNCQGVMGAGVALIVKTRYPEAYKDYLHFCSTRDPEHLLGKVRISEDNGQLIAHMFTQYNTGYSGRFVSYDAVDDCLLDSRLAEMKLEHIAMPKIGSGLGGGKWEVIEAIINHRLKNHKVVVYEL